MASASVSGIPAMRPMVFDHPGDQRFAGTAGQFMFGDDILAAPVLAEGETTKTVDLPQGRWYDFWSGTGMQGGASYSVPAPIGRLPLFVPAGATIPMQQVVQHTGEAPINPLTLRTFPAENGISYVSHYYEDDGTSFRYLEGASLRRTFTARSFPDRVVLSISAAEGAYLPLRRGLGVQFIDFGTKAPSHVSLNGVTLAQSVPGRRSIDGTGWEFDAPTRTLYVRVLDREQAMDFVVSR
jgi:alpha-glucosidase